jgi:hypothetical protein
MTAGLSVGPAKFCRGGDITFAHYGTGETAILIERNGEREAVATVCLAGVPGSPVPGPHQVWLKGWSENEGIPQALEEVDLESGAQVQWLIGTIDREAYEAVLNQENTAIAAIKSAEKRRKQDELAAALLKDNPELQSLQSVGSDVALVAPPAPTKPPASMPDLPDMGIV